MQDLFQGRIIGGNILNNSESGDANEFFITNLPNNCSVRWSISDNYGNITDFTNPSSVINNYFSLTNIEQSKCIVKYNKVIDSTIYGVEKTKLKAQIYTRVNGTEYIQSVDEIDVVYLGEFTGSFMQESSSECPGIPQTLISSQNDNYGGSVPDIEVSDSGIVVLPEEPIRMTMRQIREQTSNGVSPNKPIFIYPKGKVLFKSEFFKYLHYGYNTPSTVNANVDCSKYSDGEIRFEIEKVNELLPFVFGIGGKYKNVYLNFVSIEFDQPTLICIEPYNSSNLIMGLYAPEDMRKGNWTYEVYDNNMAMLVHTESFSYASSHSLNFAPILNHSYTITVFNANYNIILSIKYIANHV